MNRHDKIVYSIVAANCVEYLLIRRDVAQENYSKRTKDRTREKKKVAQNNN